MTIPMFLASLENKMDALHCPDCGKKIAYHFEGIIKMTCRRCGSEVLAVKLPDRQYLAGTGRKKF